MYWETSHTRAHRRVYTQDSDKILLSGDSSGDQSANFSCQQRREKELVTGSRKGLRYSFLCLYCPSERWLPGKLFDEKLFRVYFMWNHCNVNEEETTFPRYVQLRAYAVYIRSAFDNEKWVMVDGKPFQSCQLSVKLCNNFLFVS